MKNKIEALERKVRLKVDEVSHILISITRAMCNGDSQNANDRIKKKAYRLVGASKEVLDLLEKRSILATRYKKESAIWEKVIYEVGPPGYHRQPKPHK